MWDLLEKLRLLLVKLQDLLKQKPVEVPILVKVKSKAWCGGTIQDRQAMMDLAKKVCLEENLNEQLTKDLLATIWGESGWNQYCENTITHDFGLCQFSERYYFPLLGRNERYDCL